MNGIIGGSFVGGMVVGFLTCVIVYIMHWNLVWVLMSIAQQTTLKNTINCREYTKS